LKGRYARMEEKEYNSGKGLTPHTDPCQPTSVPIPKRGRSKKWRVKKKYTKQAKTLGYEILKTPSSRAFVEEPRRKHAEKV